VFSVVDGVGRLDAAGFASEPAFLALPGIYFIEGAGDAVDVVVAEGEVAGVVVLAVQHNLEQDGQLLRELRAFEVLLYELQEVEVLDEELGVCFDSFVEGL
jgi:hypothetical protein